ncbi:MAG: hypothetical protein WAR80_11445 [Ferruginibacter sp.]
MRLFKDYLNFRKIHFWTSLIIIAGIALRSIHFFGRSSMWFDELTNALNVQSHSFYQLVTQSLDFNQVAPVGFLLLEKTATTIFGENDLAFRFFPWVCSIVSLFLFLSICKQFLKGGFLLASFILFAGSVTQWFYAGEAKQYSGEVTAALFLTWSALQMMKPQLKRPVLWTIAGVGFIFILSSFSAMVIAPFVLGVVLLPLWKKRIDLPKRYFFIIAGCWAIACALAAWYAKFVISSTVNEAMTGYWSRGFAPLHSFTGYLLWIPKTLFTELSFFLSAWMEYAVPSITLIAATLLILSIPGIIFLAKKYGSATLILFAPTLAAIVLATFRVLPFDTRVAVYATWPFVISGIAGIASLNAWLPFLFRPALSIALSLLIAFPIICITIIFPSERPPFNAQSAQPLLKELKKKLQPGDKLYVYYRGRHAMHFYGPKEGIAESAYLVGGDHKNIVPYLRELDQFKGSKRVWFFFTQWVPPKPYPDSMKIYLGNVIGKEIGKIADPDGNTEDMEVAAHLYDLTEQK